MTPEFALLLLASLASAAYPSSTPSPQQYPSCGGFTIEPNECQGGTCISDPRKPGCGLACDEPGICVPEDVSRCGGYAGLKCSEGMECFDDPADGCDPDNGGFDCTGFCLVALE